jgi:hypothetical protein
MIDVFLIGGANADIRIFMLRLQLKIRGVDLRFTQRGNAKVPKLWKHEKGARILDVLWPFFEGRE